MNYFEFYELPLSFFVDEKALKRKYYQKSRDYHPDFFAQQGAELQEEALQLSTYNNEAYKALKTLDGRIKYVLTLKGKLVEGERYQLPQQFLLAMMDINEALMELEFDFDASTHQSLVQQLQELEDALLTEVADTLEKYDDTTENSANLEKVKEFYYKKRYLLRISKSLNKFAV